MLNATNITTLRQGAFTATRQEIIEQRQKKIQKQRNKKSWSKQRETPKIIQKFGGCNDKSERETEKFGGWAAKVPQLKQRSEDLGFLFFIFPEGGCNLLGSGLRFERSYLNYSYMFIFMGCFGCFKPLGLEVSSCRAAFLLIFENLFRCSCCKLEKEVRNLKLSFWVYSVKCCC